MIEISITGAFIIYSLVIAVLGIVLWGMSEIGARKIYTAFRNQNVWECEYCAFIYLDTEAEEISQCPRCYSYNMISAMRNAMRDERKEESEEPRRNPSHKKHPNARHRGPRKRR